MTKRFVAVWFRFLETDWYTRCRPVLAGKPFVLSVAEHGRKVAGAVNVVAFNEGITVGMPVVDAKAMLPGLQVFDGRDGQAVKLLQAIGVWCDRFTPAVSVDGLDGLVLDVTGCAYLWGGETAYISEMVKRLADLGYHIRAGMADTVGAAWACARFGKTAIVAPGKQNMFLLDLPPAALRLPEGIERRLLKLGFRQIKTFISMQRSVLRRRFGEDLLLRMDQALGNTEEFINPLLPEVEYRERLPCPDPVVTRTAIEIALRQLLEKLCIRLEKEGKGGREMLLKVVRIDGKVMDVKVSTVYPSVNVVHLFRLFELKIESVEPGMGIELFTLEAVVVEDILPKQEAMFELTGDLADREVAELVDRISGKLPDVRICRYFPKEHYWPELSVAPVQSLTEEVSGEWPAKPRPVMLLPEPCRIEVTAPVPDYPPMLFRYKGVLHKVKKADGPERIERVWWIDNGLHRDYYVVEDENGYRYWLFRLGHYNSEQPPGWFIHGFFA